MRNRRIDNAGLSLYFDSRRWPARRRARPRAAAGRTCRLQHGLVTGVVSIRHDEYETSTRLKVLHAQQYQHGLKVYRSSRVVEICKGVSQITPPLHRLPAKLALKPQVSPVEALAAALAFLKDRNALAKGVRLAGVRQTQFGHLADLPTVVELRAGLATPARLHLEIFPEPGARAELAWVINLALRNGLRVEMVVAARRRARVLFLAQTNTCAFTADWVPVPGTTVQGDVFPVSPLATPDDQPGAPSEWSSATTLAEGPNVRCVSGAPPDTDARGSLPVDNVFVWCNLLHDFFAGFGFDARHGAFEGKDPLEVDRLTSRNQKAGEYDNQLDGSSPLVLLYSTPFPGGQHAALDPGVVIHEYVHGVTSRLVGGGACLYPFVGEEALGLSEGFSDYFALTILNHVDRSRGGAGTITTVGGSFRPGGLREYANYRQTLKGRSRDRYRTGMIWCGALLEARATIITPQRTPDLVDGFLWQACVDAFKTMAPAYQDTLTLTLARAKDSLVAAASALEASRSVFAGAAAALAGVLGAWGI